MNAASGSSNYEIVFDYEKKTIELVPLEEGDTPKITNWDDFWEMLAAGWEEDPDGPV